MPATAENFVLVGSRDPLDLIALDKALDYLSQSPTAAAVVAEQANKCDGTQSRVVILLA